MFPIDSFKNSLLKFVEILNRLEIAFHLTSGFTGVAYGEPRLTQVIDIVAENSASLEKLEKLISKFRNSEFVLPNQLLSMSSETKGCFSSVILLKH